MENKIIQSEPKRNNSMAMWVLHVSSILAAVALRSRASDFLTNLLSVRACTRQNWTFCSFSSSVGKLHLSARALRQSTSSSGVPPGLIHTSSNWYIQHLWDTVWSIWDAKWTRKDFLLFLVAFFSHLHIQFQSPLYSQFYVVPNIGFPPFFPLIARLNNFSIFSCG